MTQVGEPIAKDKLVKEFKAKCPFSEDDTKGGPEASEEDLEDDDLEKVKGAQRNKGGTLGTNLIDGKKGSADGGPYPPTEFLFEQEPDDTKRGDRKRKIGIESEDIEAGEYPFAVAAHHLIPGNASGIAKGSANKERTKLFYFMEKNGEVETISGKTYKIKYHIGYDVNGSHNGVWLPGDHGITRATSPLPNTKWSELSSNHEPWQLAYVAGACKATTAQFHGAHDDPYNDSVRQLLAKMTEALHTHLDSECEICGEETEIPPPYRIKRRLYALSRRLRLVVTGHPYGWQKKWITSSRWCDKYYDSPYYVSTKLSKDFRKVFVKATVTDPDLPNLPS